MKVLFVGLGSIGTRHLKNLHSCCDEKGIPLEVTALRSSSAVLPEQTVPLVQKLVQVLPDETYDMAFITGPTHLHAKTIASLKGKVESFFIEKPIFESSEYDLEALGLEYSQKAYIAAPMRWCGVYMALKKELEQYQPYSVRSICSSYLPSWRPAADYTKVYSAHKKMGGGVSLDLIHEWDYLVDLFGKPVQTFNLQGTFSHLEIDSDDLSVYIAQYKGFLCELHLDYFGRSYRREVEIFTTNGSLVADFGTGILYYPDGTQKDFSEDVNMRYIREMNYFIEYSQGKQTLSINSPEQALAVLKIALGE